MVSINKKRRQAGQSLKTNFPDAKYEVFTNPDSRELRYKCGERECKGFECAGRGNFMRHLNTQKHQKIVNDRLMGMKDGKASKGVKTDKDAELLQHYIAVIIAGIGNLGPEQFLQGFKLFRADAAVSMTDDNGDEIQSPEGIGEFDFELDPSTVGKETVLAVYDIICESVPGVLEQHPKP